MAKISKKEKEFWSKLNDVCLHCKKFCKQSAKVIIVRCPQAKFIDKYCIDKYGYIHRKRK